MDNLTPVEGMSGLYRDQNSCAIINKNRSEYESYMARKKSMERKSEELDKMKEELDNVKSDIGDIKDMLSTIVQKLNS
jgi:chaperonin cofactor prefoldin